MDNRVFHVTIPEASDEAGWCLTLAEFVKAREENENTVAGLFESVQMKTEFCEGLKTVLLERYQSEHCGGWAEETVERILQSARMLMCDRDESLNTFFESDAMKGYIYLASLGEVYSGEALKCLNNALYDHPVNQRTFCELPAKDGRDLLAKVFTNSTEDLQAFHRASFVFMYLTAGDQELEESDFSFVVCEACIKGLLEISVKYLLDGNMFTPFCGDDHGELPRQALDAGLRAVYAVSAKHESLLERFVQSALEHEHERGGEPRDLEDLAISDETVHFLDRLGLLLAAIVNMENPESETDLEAVDDLKNQAITVMMLPSTMPKVCTFLVSVGAVDSLIEILRRRMNGILGQSTEKSFTYFSQLLPLLIVCTNIAQNSQLARSLMKHEIFSEELPPIDIESLTHDEIQKQMNDRKMQGCTPKDSFGGQIISLMTCMDSQLKRYAGEFLYVLCGEDAGEMTRLCGYGYSAHILAIKGGTIGQIIAQQDADAKAKEEAQSRGKK